MRPFLIHEPRSEPLPVLLSVPHCGTKFPDEVATQLDSKQVNHPEDTDWFVDRLYDFAPDLGITMITARFSRFVVDLNRDPEGAALYQDGRTITSVVPMKTFAGRPLYGGSQPDHDEVARRVESYFMPYHGEVRSQLARLKDRFGQVLFFDAHSIRRSVPTIHPEPFPDLILGDNDGRSAASAISTSAREILGKSSFGLSYNEPFRGGYLTRSIGLPEDGIHALQLEMSQSIYMDETACLYSEGPAAVVRSTLQKLFSGLVACLKEL